MDDQQKKVSSKKPKPFLRLVSSPDESSLLPAPLPAAEPLRPKSRLASELKTFADQLDRDIDFWLKL